MILRTGLVWVLYAGAMVGQSTVVPMPETGQGGVAAQPPKFEVVSIRQNVANEDTDSFGATPDGFRMINVSLFRLITTVYIPESDGALFWEPKGVPTWAGRERYDIQAKVSEADIPLWQNPALQPAMLRAMMQQLLADRCKLVVHRVFEDAAIYNLVVGKGPKLKESKVDEPYPDGQESRYPGGGLIDMEGESMHFYHAPMTLLASMLTNRNLGGRPVLDRTGLAGSYDFVVPWGAWTGGVGSADGTASDPGPTLRSAVEAIGLKLVPANGKMENLVLDHIERPSEN